MRPPGAPGGAPYQVDLDADTARQLASAGASVVMLDVPVGSVVGVDHQAFAVGPKFKGVKMMPPGVHLLSWQAAGKEGASAPTVSRFVDLASRQVYVMRWSAAEEITVPLADEEEAERIAAAVRRFELDAGLAPYALGQYGDWRSLSSHITPAVLQQLTPVGGLISTMHEASDPQLTQPKTEAERRLVQQLQEGRDAAAQRAGGGLAAAEGGADSSAQQQPAAGEQPMAVDAVEAGPVVAEEAASRQQPASSSGRCFYTRLNKYMQAPGGLRGAALSAAHMDRSDALQAVIQGSWGGDAAGLLGELQFAFVAFVYGQSLDGYQQWKALLSLLLGCEQAALGLHAPLYESLMEVLLAQLSQGLAGEGDGGSGGGPGSGAPAPAPFGVALLEELLPDSFLRAAFRGFFEMLRDNEGVAPSGLQLKAGRLEAWLRDHLGWDFRLELLGEGDDDDEFAPVVVELSEEQRAALLGS